MQYARVSRIGFLGVLVGLWALTAGAEPAHVNVIELDDQIITPVTQGYITEAISSSETDGAACLVILLDTPGGLMDSTRAIVKRMMNAKVPVVVYVAPSGSRAGSAGVFITLAAHIAAMAPSTNIGAAHPVTMGGGLGEPPERPGESPGKKESTASDHETSPATRTGDHGKEAESKESASPMADKILNDSVAWIRTIAKTYGRNADWAEKAVTQSVSITEDEALKEHVIDLVAEDLADLLAQINGRSVRVLGESITLDTANPSIVRISMSSMQKFLATLAHPNIAYLLMMLGMLGLIFEFTHPGFGFPGIAGAVCVLLALYSFRVLPVNYVALALILLGIVLLVAEVKVTSYGLLALGGIVCLTLGGVMLFQSPDPSVRVSPWLVLPSVLTLAAITLFLVYRVVRSRAIPVATGAQGLLGKIGEAATDLNPEGFVFIHGENWTARSAVPVPRGGNVRVVRVEGLKLEVEPVESHFTRP